MSYLAVTLNHLRAVREWARMHQASVSLDMLTMQLEVRARSRYFTLYPRFLARVGGRLAHCSELTEDVTGFIGWLPYQTLRWDLATDKLAFRQHLLDQGLPVPAAWRSAAQAQQPFLMKRSMGSFGYAQRGPYHPGQAGDAPPGESGELYAEAFIAGTNLKLWVWGEQAFFAHLQDYPTLTGDGHAQVGELLAARLAQAGATLDDITERTAVEDCLRFHGLSLESTLTAGQAVWFDYRYGRLYETSKVSAKSDNGLARLADIHTQQIRRTLDALTPTLQQHFAAPVLYALDGVIDSEGTLWWLEMNSNPILPPEGYAPIFNTLFGTPLP
jgi:hypothetical protein